MRGQLVRLRRPDNCAECGANLEPGQEARYYRETGKVYGTECHGGGRAGAAPRSRAPNRGFDRRERWGNQRQRAWDCLRGPQGERIDFPPEEQYDPQQGRFIERDAPELEPPPLPEPESQGLPPPPRTPTLEEFLPTDSAKELMGQLAQIIERAGACWAILDWHVRKEKRDKGVSGGKPGNQKPDAQDPVRVREGAGGADTGKA